MDQESTPSPSYSFRKILLHTGRLYFSSDLDGNFPLASYQKINHNVSGKSVMKISLSS